jgi:hypothetical protein
METKVPQKEVFEQCEKKNPHGGGVSWISKEKLYFKKGIDAAEIYEIAAEFGPPCVAHFRISTIGGTPKELCHPFIVSKKSELHLEGTADSVLFHNGVYNNWEKVCFNMVLNKNAVYPEGAMSDSRAMAWITAHCNPTWLDFIGQKTVIQTKDKRIYSGLWQKEDGAWYSNMYWKAKEPKYIREDDWWKKYQDEHGNFDMEKYNSDYQRGPCK